MRDAQRLTPPTGDSYGKIDYESFCVFVIFAISDPAGIDGIPSLVLGTAIRTLKWQLILSRYIKHKRNCPSRIRGNDEAVSISTLSDADLVTYLRA